MSATVVVSPFAVCCTLAIAPELFATLASIFPALIDSWAKSLSALDAWTLASLAVCLATVASLLAFVAVRLAPFAVCTATVA